MIYLNLVFEDQLSEFILIKLLGSFNGKFEISQSYSGGGFGYIKNNVRGFNQACASIPFVVLTDLDLDVCASSLIEQWLPKPHHPNLIFRVAVREVEAWLLGDAEGFSKFSRTPITRIPNNPELEKDPKRTIINLVNRYSKRSLREDIVPLGTASIGKNYNRRLIEFVVDYWNIQSAISSCDSLRRFYARLSAYEPTF